MLTSCNFLDRYVRVTKLLDPVNSASAHTSHVEPYRPDLEASPLPYLSPHAKQPITCQNPPNATSNSTSNRLPTIIAITPTYKRLTQKLDLVSLCNTIMHVPSLLWVIIEDSGSKSSLVANVLQRCRVDYVHLNAVTSAETKKAGQRGVEQRNTGLDWARKYCREHCTNNCSGVVYFMDDDNRYDLRLFTEVSSQSISMGCRLYQNQARDSLVLCMNFMYPCINHPWIDRLCLLLYSVCVGSIDPIEVA